LSGARPPYCSRATHTALRTLAWAAASLLAACATPPVDSVDALPPVALPIPTAAAPEPPAPEPVVLAAPVADAPAPNASKMIAPAAPEPPAPEPVVLAAPVADAPVRAPNASTMNAPAAPPFGPSVPEMPLDISELPPFDGRKEVVREPLRGLALVDRTAQPNDLWQRIRLGFAIPELDNKLVERRMAWYAARPDYLQRIFERSRLYLYYIVDELEKRGMPTELALLPMVESAYNPMAYSRSHASGLWQFIPGTGKRYELKQNWWYDARRDIVDSTSAALDYLNDLYEMHGDWLLALASYNWGENAVARALRENRARGRPLEYSSLRMPAETRHYVPKLQAMKNIIANPAPFGIVLDPIPNQPYFATVAKTRDIDVRLAAQLAEMTLVEFVALNPGFSRPLIPVAVNPRIVLPADKVEVFRENLLKHDENALVSWQTYRPKRGEALETIARKFDLPLAKLKEVNGIHGRSRGVPPLLVVPAPGAKLGRASPPIMYAPPIPAPSADAIYYRVRPGDTLSGIALRYGVSVADLKYWNQLGRLLIAGQSLRIEPRRVVEDATKGGKKN